MSERTTTGLAPNCDEIHELANSLNRIYTSRTEDIAGGMHMTDVEREARATSETTANETVEDLQLELSEVARMARVTSLGLIGLSETSEDTTNMLIDWHIQDHRHYGNCGPMFTSPES